MSDSLWAHGLSPWNSPGQNTGVGISLSLLQGIFPTQGSNPGLPHCRQILYQVSYGSFHQFSCLVVSDSATLWIAARQASLSITNSQSFLKLMSIELVMPSSHLILCRPLLLLLQSLPASGSFPMSQLFAWGGPSIGVSASASVLPMNTQDWSPLDGLVGSPCSPRDYQESSPTP